MSQGDLPRPIDPSRWTLVEDVSARIADSFGIGALACVVFGPDWSSPPVCHGKYAFERETRKTTVPVSGSTIFLTASLTKPVLALGILKLVERGDVALSDRVVEFIPEFSSSDRKRTTLLQLLTHTSGLPDMLPNNRALRAANAPLSAFVEGTCSVTLDYPPGHGVQYQSMGYALLGEIIRRVSGASIQQFLADELFSPLGMRDTSLGVPSAWERGDLNRSSRIAPVELPKEQQEADADSWNWNSKYWREFGAPWGGMFSTIEDLTRLCRMMLDEGTLEGCRVLAPQTVQSAVSNQLVHQREVPEGDRRARGWGLGWRLNWKDHSACFCDLAGPNAYGHFGATGTLMFVDPALKTGVIILSTRPLDRGANWMARLANLLMASVTTS